MPWLPLAQLLRGMMWAWLGMIVFRTMRGSTIEKALAMGIAFAIVMNAGLLLPNPYMPADVRIAHVAETTSSNFVFGVLLAWLIARHDRASDGRFILRALDAGRRTEVQIWQLHRSRDRARLKTMCNHSH